MNQYFNELWKYVEHFTSWYFLHVIPSIKVRVKTKFASFLLVPSLEADLFPSHSCVSNFILTYFRALVKFISYLLRFSCITWFSRSLWKLRNKHFMTQRFSLWCSLEIVYEKLHFLGLKPEYPQTPTLFFWIWNEHWLPINFLVTISLPSPLSLLWLSSSCLTLWINH